MNKNKRLAALILCLVIVTLTGLLSAQARLGNAKLDRGDRGMGMRDPEQMRKTMNDRMKVGRVPVDDILRQLGAKLERGSEAKEIDAYSSHFDRMDTNRDGKHTRTEYRTEYVDKGGYMTPQARAGIFRAADGNADGVVTKAEYVLNRIITDEAKAIVQGMDDDKDGLVERVEFVKHAARLLSDPELAEPGCFPTPSWLSRSLPRWMPTPMAGFPFPSTCEFGGSGHGPGEGRPSSASRCDGRSRGKFNRLLRIAPPVQWD